MKPARSFEVRLVIVLNVRETTQTRAEKRARDIVARQGFTCEAPK